MPSAGTAAGVSEGEPPLSLRDFFATPLLQPGESAAVRFTLDRRSYSVWDVDAYSWRAVPGSYSLRVGASSRDIRVQGGFVV